MQQYLTLPFVPSNFLYDQLPKINVSNSVLKKKNFYKKKEEMFASLTWIHMKSFPVLVHHLVFKPKDFFSWRKKKKFDDAIAIKMSGKPQPAQNLIWWNPTNPSSVLLEPPLALKERADRCLWCLVPNRSRRRRSGTRAVSCIRKERDQDHE